MVAIAGDNRGSHNIGGLLNISEKVDIFGECGEIDQPTFEHEPFSKLNFFHVCQPGLPHCLGHDLF